MGIIIRQSLKSTSVTIFSAVLGALNTVALMYLLPKAELGLFNMSIAYAIFAAEIILLISHNIYNVFVKKYQAQGREIEAGFLRYLLKPNVLIIGLLLSTAFVFSIFVAPRLNLEPHTFYYYFNTNIWLFVGLCLSLVFYTFFGFLLGANHKNTLASIMLYLVPRLFNLLIILGLYLAWIDSQQAIKLLFSQYFVAFLLGLFFVLRYHLSPLSPSVDISYSEKKEIQDFRYSHIPFVIIQLLSVHSAAIIFSFYAEDGFRNFATFSISIFLSNFMNIPFDQLARSAMSTLGAKMRDQNWDEVDDMYKRASLSLFQITSVMVMLILSGLHLLIYVSKGKYEDLLIIAPFFLFAKWVDVSAGFNTQLIMGSDKYKAIIRISLVSLVFMILCYAILIPMLGVIGVALTIFLWNVFNNFYKMYFVQKEYGLYPFIKRKSLFSLLLSIPFFMVVMGVMYRSDSIFLNLVVGFACAGAYILLIYLLRINTDLNVIVQNVSKRIKG